jgi:VanZ family protein
MRKLELAPLIGCIVVSISSELIQLFVPTRTPAFADLGLDLLGAVLGTISIRRYSLSSLQPSAPS